MRASYALTLRRWVSNLESNETEAIRVAGERPFRIWRLYMAGSAVAFERGAIGVYQMLLADAERPWTFGRAGLLARDDTAADLRSRGAVHLMGSQLPRSRELRNRR